MRTNISVSAEVRQERGKNEARRLRVRGLSPAIVYGSGKEAIAVSVSPKEITKILHGKTGHNTIFDLAIQGGETTPVMLVDWQLDPVKDSLLHVDLKRIDLTRRLKVSIPVHTEGVPRGVKEQSGLLEIVNREIEVECLPDEIPGHLTIDIREMLIGQSIRASDVPLSGSMQLMSQPDAVVAHVVVLRALVEAEAAPAAEGEGAEAAAEPAEPEVVKRGKKEPAEPEVAKRGKKEEEK